MAFLSGKKILITGLISNRSIAYGIAKACFEQGAELAFTYVVDKLKDRVINLAKEFNSDLVYRLDVQDDKEIDNLFVDLKSKWNHLDGLVHAIAFAPKEALEKDFLEGCTREAYRMAHDISAYSLPALARAAKPLMTGTNGSIVALTYLGSTKAIENYNTMGLAKASLEAAVRYTAAALGKEGIRCNAISAGPIKTLAASGISGFSKSLKFVEKQSMLKRNVTTLEVGNVAAFLLSDLSSGITGDIIFVDAGFNVNNSFDLPDIVK